MDRRHRYSESDLHSVSMAAELATMEAENDVLGEFWKIFVFSIRVASLIVAPQPLSLAKST